MIDRVDSQNWLCIRVLPMIDRRGFFQSCWLATLAGSARFSLAAHHVSSKPSLGFSLYGMKSLSLELALKTCAEIGYSHVEFALNEGYPTFPTNFSAEDRQAARGQLDKLKLNLPCMMLNLSLTADSKTQASYLEAIKTAGQLSHELAPDNPPFLESVLGGSPTTWDQQKQLMLDNLHRWAEAATQAKIAIAIKAHVRSAVNSPERLMWLVEQVKSPSILVAYDYSHFELQGIGLRDSMAVLLPHAKFIHVKDTVGNAEKFEFLLPGQGKTDYVQYFSLLREFGYTGPVCVEVSSQVFNKPAYDPVQAARSCFQALSKAM